MKTKKLFSIMAGGILLVVASSYYLQSQITAPQTLPEISASALEAKKIRDARRQALRPQNAKATRELTANQKKILMRGADPKLQELTAVLDLIEKHQIEAAEAQLHELIKQKPNEPAFHMELAMIDLFDRDDKPQALVSLKTALLLAPNHTALQEETMRTFIALKAYNDALAFFKKLTKEHPGAKGIPYILAQISWAESKVKTALTYLDTAIADQADSYKSYALRSKIHIKNHKWLAAKSDLTKAVAGYEEAIRQKLLHEGNVSLLTDDLEVLQFDLADVHMHLDEYDNAFQVVAKLAERIPDDPRVTGLIDRLYRIKEFSQL